MSNLVPEHLSMPGQAIYENPAEQSAYLRGVIAGQAAAHLLIGIGGAEDYITARTSEVTGLPNKRALKERLETLRDSGELSNYFLLMGDGDQFKAVNDTHGHEVGDDVLRETGYALIRALRTIYNPQGTGQDEVFQISGDEFAALLHKDKFTTENDVDATRLRVNAEMNGVLERDPRLQVLGYGLSIGVVNPIAYETIKEMKEAADAEMRLAKKIHHNKVGTYNRETRQFEPPSTAETPESKAARERRRALLQRTYTLPVAPAPSSVDEQL